MFVGEGNGNPLQYSCLENPMDREAWWATVHEVAKSWTWLGDFTFTFHFHALEKEMTTHSSVLAWRIPGTGEPGGLLSMGSHRVRHNWSDIAQQQHVCTNIYYFFLSFPHSFLPFLLLSLSWICTHTFFKYRNVKYLRAMYLPISPHGHHSWPWTWDISFWPLRFMMGENDWRRNWVLFWLVEPCSVNL